jgi:hypothetical protein
VRMLRQNAALDDMSSMDANKQKPLLRAPDDRPRPPRA